MKTKLVTAAALALSLTAVATTVVLSGQEDEREPVPMEKVIWRPGVIVDPNWTYILVCCPTSGVNCWPVDTAGECPGTHILGECECPSTLPDGTTYCGCG